MGLNSDYEEIMYLLDILKEKVSILKERLEISKRRHRKGGG